MKTFKEFFLESKTKIVYHGGTEIIKNFDIKFYLTDHSNAQEGPGIYFTDLLDGAYSYGKIITQYELNDGKFVDSRKTIKQNKLTKELIAFIELLIKENPEDIFYIISNYIEVTEPDELRSEIAKEIVENYMNEEETRNVLIEIAQNINIKDFYNAFIRIFGKKIEGLSHKQNTGEIFYAVIIGNDSKLKEYKG